MRVEGERLPAGDASHNEFLRYLGSAAVANLIVPIFILFLPLLAVQLGASILEIGLVGGSSSVVYSFMPFVMGRFSDRGGLRKLFIFGSLVLLTVVGILYFIVNDPVTLIIIRLFEGIGWATLWPSIESALTHDPTRDPQRSLSIFNFSWSGTAAIGPLVGSFLILALSLRLVFLSAAVILIGVALANLVPMLSQRSAAAKSRNDNGSGELASSSEASHRVSEEIKAELGDTRKINPSFYFVSMVLCIITSNILLTFFPPYAKSLGMSIVMIGVASFVYGFARFLMYLLTVRKDVRYFLLRQDRRKMNVVLALVAMTLVSTLLTLRDESGLTYLLYFAVVGASYSIVYTIALVAMLAETRRDRMGAGAGLFESSIGVGGATGPVVAGIVSGNTLSTAFLVPAMFLLPTLGILFFASRSGKAKNPTVGN